MNPLSQNISWRKNKVQEEVLPYLQGCFSDPMTDKQKTAHHHTRDSSDRESCENTGIAVAGANAQGPLSDSASFRRKGRLSVSCQIYQIKTVYMDKASIFKRLLQAAQNKQLS